MNNKYDNLKLERGKINFLSKNALRNIGAWTIVGTASLIGGIKSPTAHEFLLTGVSIYSVFTTIMQLKYNNKELEKIRKNMKIETINEITQIENKKQNDDLFEMIKRK